MTIAMTPDINQSIYVKCDEGHVDFDLNIVVFCQITARFGVLCRLSYQGYVGYIEVIASAA